LAAAESYPDDLKYNRDHDWARVEGDEAVLGITWFAADSLGELVHYEAPEPGTTVAKDASYGEVESVKAVSDVFCPLSGEVVEVNAALETKPELVNQDCYGAGWMIVVTIANPKELDALMDVKAYEAFLASEEPE